jgi:hypothetical protein
MSGWISVSRKFAVSLTALAAASHPRQSRGRRACRKSLQRRPRRSWHLTGGINERPPAEKCAITEPRWRAIAEGAWPAGTRRRNEGRAERRGNGCLPPPLTPKISNMRLLGLHWAGTGASTLKRLAAPILAAQRADGGWRQHDALASDAYATGQSLYVLSKTGALAPTDLAYAKGVTYLLTTQNANGSWRVASRAPKLQAFQQRVSRRGSTISAWATGWAAMALAQAVQ